MRGVERPPGTMASNDHERIPQHEHAELQSIPLRDLARGPESDDDDNMERGRRRSNSSDSLGGGRAHFPRRSLRLGRGVGTYERIAEEPPSPTDRVGLHIDVPSVTRSRSDRDRRPSSDLGSPLDDLGGFAQAVGSIDIGFGQPSRGNPPSSSRDGDDDAYPLDSYSSARRHRNESDDFMSAPPNDDTAPLTDKRYLQPISGAPDADNDSSRRGSHDSRLGDDLEGGFRNRSRGNSSAGESRSRSLSPSTSGSALHRAGTVITGMSQRVVNLSNEPEVMEQSMRRDGSLKDRRRDRSPASSAASDLMDDHEPPRDKPSVGTDWKTHANPFRGKSLGIFPPDNPLRLWLCDVLTHPFTEPFILVLIIIQTVLLTVESAQSVYDHPRSDRWGSSGLDYAFFVIFVIYTVEVVARSIVSGFLWNPVEYSTLDRSLGLKNALIEKGRDIFTLHREPSTKKKSVRIAEPQVTVLNTFTGLQSPTTDLSDDPRHRQRVRLAHRAFLRHSFNRLDFIAVVSYWISFILMISGYDSMPHVYIFDMMSCLRTLRLLVITNGTSVILRSLKKAAPLLVHVGFLIGFFWLLFAIIGIQGFKSSFRRSCVWIDPQGKENYTMNDSDCLQLCGGYIDAVDGTSRPWLYADGTPSSGIPKGYLCPPGSVCMEGSNPYNNTISFDNILGSLEMIFVIMSSNTFTDIMYNTTDSDYLIAALFFAVGFVILSLWLVNLLVAVITSSFQVIREESKRSAFANEKLDDVVEEEEEHRKSSQLKRIYDKTNWFWVLLITFDLIVQALRSATMSRWRQNFINSVETFVTFALLFEILIRFLADWRGFHRSRRNLVDLALAIITCIIQIPPIRNSGRPYDALTLFQILRVYRVVLAFPVTRNMIMIVFRNITGLLNLILFVFLMTFLASILAVQLFRGLIPETDDAGETIPVTFFHIYNAFLGMYQILSSENWSEILYRATSFTAGYKTAWISAAFIIMWFILANFIIINMFIAVIQESFDVSEDQKRLHQIKAFLQQKEIGSSSSGTFALTSIFKMNRDSRLRDPLDYGPATTEMLLKDAVVREFLDDQEPLHSRDRTDSQSRSSRIPGQVKPVLPGLLSRLWAKVTSIFRNREENPFYSRMKFSKAYEELDPRDLAREVVMASEQRKRAQREYLRRHPRYNKSLYIFAPDNPIRKACQRLVGPGRGQQRIEGVDPYKPVAYTFSAFIYACIVAMVAMACVTTPLYQRDYFKDREYTTLNWFVWTDIGFSLVFTVEAVIKVIADGFFFTPNAYFRSSWGFIDGIVLITLWINVITSLLDSGSVSRIIGAFKALRALRLLNVSDSARNTFHSVIIVGGFNVISAAFVSMSFLVPFAIYGLNLFNGKMAACNDDSIEGDLSACVGEYQSSPYHWDVLAPRVVSNPWFSFDNFGESLFILFQIVSQEGWTDVSWSAMSITGRGQQPEPFASEANGLFFVVFNLLGAVFVLTLFVSVFMRNYTEQTGVAFLTAEQRSWLELRKLLLQINPSKRSVYGDSKKWRQWCYRVAVKKHGRWARFITGLLVLHLLLLCVEFYPSVSAWEKLRGALFLIFTLFYIANVAVRILGLGWQRFSRSSWDCYSLIAVPGTFITTILAFFVPGHAIQQLHKLFLVAVTLLIIPRNNQLDQLFKTAAASLSRIGNLLATWFVLFLVFAIATTQTFGLTKFGENGAANINFRDISKALILLFRASVGEGWNQVMEDYATMVPPYCTLTDQFFTSDCGSPGWARGLFIAWNIISMYIFVSLFVSLIFESFSYVYQRSSGLYKISREDIRRFKEAWAHFDPDGTGYISKEHFPRLLGELSGVFEMRIYDGEFTVNSILEKCQINNPRNSVVSFAPEHSSGEREIDIKKLASIIDRIPVATIRARRQRLNAFYEEVLVSADPKLGINFTRCLLTLAHYKVINDSKSLRLEEFLRRRQRLQRVEETVRWKTVIGFFDTLYWSQRFRRRIESKRDATIRDVASLTVPAIFIDTEEADERASERQGQDTSTAPPSPSGSLRSVDLGSPSQRSRPSLHIDTSNLSADHGSRSSSPPTTEWSRFGPALSPRAREMPDSGAAGSLSRGSLSPPMSPSHGGDTSAISMSEVIQSLGDSAWGESIRRSFTQRRPQS